MITFLRTNTSKKFVVYCMKIRDELLGIAKYVLLESEETTYWLIKLGNFSRVCA